MNASILSRAVLIVLALQLIPKAHGQSFSDDFNRPDSLTAGNGWLDAMDNPAGAHLGIVGDRLSPTSANVAAVYRSFSAAGPIVMSAVITDENGYYCGNFRKRYALSFGIRNDGTINGGYQINFSRGDQTYDSYVSIYENGTRIAYVQSSFEFGYSLTIDYVVFNSDGSVQGRITGDGNTFDFSFPARTIVSQGQNISISTEGWGACGPGGIVSTVDNLRVYAPFPQGGAEYAPIVPGVPVKFGPCDEETRNFGCTLCSVANMLVSLGVTTTPAALDPIFIRHNAYTVDHSDVTKCDVLLFNQNMEDALAELAPVTITFTGDGVTQTADDFLGEHVVNRGERVILHLSYSKNSVPQGNHYIFVIGKNGNDWVVFDPGWRPSEPSAMAGIRSLQAHKNGIVMNGNTYIFTILGFKTFKVGQQSKFIAQAQCPVELTATDPTGHRVGFDSVTGTNIFEIADAGYSREGPIADPEGVNPPLGDPSGIKTIYIPSPSQGKYQVLTTGTGSGSYKLDIQTVWPGTGGQTFVNSGSTDIGIISTNNLVAVPPPTIQTASLSGAAITFNWGAVTGQIYQIQYKLNLTDTNWNDLGAPFTATNAIMQASDPIDFLSQKFYRIVH